MRIHHDDNMSNPEGRQTSGKREDITLLVRNFNFPMPHALKSPTIGQVRFNPIVQTTVASVQETYTSISTVASSDNFDPSSNDTSSTSEIYPPGAKPLDRNAKVKPYVDFSEYFEKVERRRQGGLSDGIDF